MFHQRTKYEYPAPNLARSVCIVLVGVAFVAIYFAYDPRRSENLMFALAEVLIAPSIYVAPLERRVGDFRPKPWVFRLVHGASWLAFAVVLVGIAIGIGVL